MSKQQAKQLGGILLLEFMDTTGPENYPKQVALDPFIKKLSIQLSGSQMILSWEDFDENN